MSQGEFLSLRVSKTKAVVTGSVLFPNKVNAEDAPMGFIGRLRNKDKSSMYDGCLVMKLYNGEIVSLDEGHGSSGIGATWDKSTAKYYMIEELPRDSVVQLTPQY